MIEDVMLGDSTGEPVTVPEYDFLTGWERTAALRRFQFYLEQGRVRWPHAREIVLDRAVFFGYRGALTRWASLIAGSWGLLGGVLQIPGESWWRNALVVAAAAAAMASLGGAVVRSRQARRRHPRYRSYRLAPEHQEKLLPQLVGGDGPRPPQ